MDPSALDTALLTTPFVSSWLSRARPGDPFDPDHTRRSAAWAHWALTSMSRMNGHGQRQYTALDLPGRFHGSPTANADRRPHLEIPAVVFTRPDAQFPDRLAQAGNALQFPWWVVPEVLAVKRAVLSPSSGDIAPLVDRVNASRDALVVALLSLTSTAETVWGVVEALQEAQPGVVSASATETFTASEIGEYWPPAAGLGMQITFDGKLAEAAKERASRRVGVWRITASGSAPFGLGVLTPRLARSSLFVDPLFMAEREAAAALLVRGLVLRRLLGAHAGVDVGRAIVQAPAPAKAPPRLRGVVARVGEKLPEASEASATAFLQSYPDPLQAWAALDAWATSRVSGQSDSRRATLAVTQESFRAAHSSARQALQNAQELDRQDINTLLPVAWDHRNRIVRVTFARAAAAER